MLEQPLADGRIATSLPPPASRALVFSTHFDCVPPFFPSRVEGDLLYGRGACDAKGILAAQVAAAERLRAQRRDARRTGVRRRRRAGQRRRDGGQSHRLAVEFLINGEPTDNRLGAATRGVFRVRLTAHGRAAHSGYPELGESAIEKLLDCLIGAARGDVAGDDPLLGTTHYTVGLINGGVAPNVVPPHAEAEVIFRTVGDHDAAARDAARDAGGDASRSTRCSKCRRCGCARVPGFETAVFAYTTRHPVPRSNWGTPLLLGPGSIHVAHTDREHVRSPNCDERSIYAKLATVARGAMAAPSLARRHAC